MEKGTKYHRASYIKDLWKCRTFSWVLAALSTAYTIFGFLRDEFFTPEQQAKWGRIMKMLPHWPTSWWIAITLGTIIIWLFESSYREARRLRTHIDELQRIKDSPLEIIFDSNNPLKKFWSIEEAFYDGVQWEYRVEIKNNSQKTLRNVSVTVEFIGQFPQRPFDQIFDKSKKKSCDLKPQCSELVPVIHWPIPIRQAGMLADQSALAYGPIKIIVSADNTPPVIRVFKFDYQREPMLFD